MAYQPLIASGIAHTVNITNSAGIDAEMTPASIVQTIGGTPLDAWLGLVSIGLADGVPVRVSAIAYETQEVESDTLWFTGPFESPGVWQPGDITDTSAAAGIIATSTTSAGTGLELSIAGDRAGALFQFLIEVDVPEPPVELGEPYIIRNTARVYRGAQNRVKAWIRTEVGKLDMSGVTTLEAVIWSGSGGAFRDGYTPGAWMWPNSGQNLLFTVPVTTPETGLAVFQLPPSGNSLRFLPSSLCYTILGDGVPLATGLIEVVG